MGLTGKVRLWAFRFALRYDLLPSRLLWKKTTRGMGEVIKETFYRFGENDETYHKMYGMFKDMGLRHGKELKEKYHLGGSPQDCALAVLAANKTWGKKCKLDVNGNEIRIILYDCAWADLEGWTPRICAFLTAYEDGLCQGINPDVGHHYIRRKSLGSLRSCIAVFGLRQK
ncbi:MAG TPA: hypothetical protein HA257_01650 [Candidatus Methanoperedenaceae archaeon]|nr:hypothetical protein [Candidatus Methanoperedenaceae archaeon]